MRSMRFAVVIGGALLIVGVRGFAAGAEPPSPHRHAGHGSADVRAPSMRASSSVPQTPARPAPTR